MTKKEKIPAAVRNIVWLKYIPDKNDARCFCCKLEKITTANWHCGHIKSEKNGGKVHISNLRPICAGCNCSMVEVLSSSLINLLFRNIALLEYILLSRSTQFSTNV